MIDKLKVITFLTKDNLLYHIIVAEEDNKKGIIKLVNSYPLHSLLLINLF